MTAIPAVEQLCALRRFGVRPGLDATRRALSLLGEPQQRYPAVHVAGTNGKGSTAALIATALRLSGVRTGLFTSPHLNRLNERIRVDDEQISDARLERLLTRVLDLPLRLTFFEAVTAVALLYFAERDVEVAVVETGLGGRLDATNLVCPLVTVITRIDLDHTDRLGHDVAAIAAEKAGIIKPGVPVVAARGVPEVESVFQQHCARHAAPLLLQARDFACLPERGGFRCFVGGGQRIGRLRLGLLGDHQWDNAALAIAALQLLEQRGLPIGGDTCRQALTRVRWPGRLEWIGNHLLDCAHNTGATRALAAALGSRKDFCLVFGALSGKPVGEMVQTLLPHASRVVFSRPAVEEAIAPEALRELVGRGETVEDLETALARVSHDPRPKLITGSTYLVGEARGLLTGAGTAVMPAIADPR